MMGTLHAQVTADGLAKLASDLHDMARRFQTPYRYGYENDPKRKRLPPNAMEYEWALKKTHKVDSLILWIAMNESAEYADRLRARLYDFHRRFAALQFEASKMLNDPDDEPVYVRFPIATLLGRHDDLLQEVYAHLERRPEREEMAPAFAWIDEFFGDGYANLQQELYGIVAMLRDTAAMIRGADLEEDGPAGVGEVRWRGKVYKCLEPTQWRFFEALWKAPNRKASLDDLAEPVNGDHSDIPLLSTAKGWASRANTCFKENDPPIPIWIKGTKGAFSVEIQES
jgi:hypothetical protein